jgi:hypothetical protein
MSVVYENAKAIISRRLTRWPILKPALVGVAISLLGKGGYSQAIVVGNEYTRGLLAGTNEVSLTGALMIQLVRSLYAVCCRFIMLLIAGHSVTVLGCVYQFWPNWWCDHTCVIYWSRCWTNAAE